jgi:hypothetical protein
MLSAIADDTRLALKGIPGLGIDLVGSLTMNRSTLFIIAAAVIIAVVIATGQTASMVRSIEHGLFYGFGREVAYGLFHGGHR